MLSAACGDALAHNDLVDEEVGEEVVSEPGERLELHLEQEVSDITVTLQFHDVCPPQRDTKARCTMMMRYR